jgi:hypothetical protein
VHGKKEEGNHCNDKDDGWGPFHNCYIEEDPGRVNPPRLMRSTWPGLLSFRMPPQSSP